MVVQLEGREAGRELDHLALSELLRALRSEDLTCLVFDTASLAAVWHGLQAADKKQGGVRSCSSPHYP